MVFVSVCFAVFCFLKLHMNVRIFQKSNLWYSRWG